MANEEPVNSMEASRPFAQEGYDFMGACFEVHRELGGGIAEEIYQESLEIELCSRGIPFISKDKLFVHYKGRQLKTRYVPDLVVTGSIVVELKSATKLVPEHEFQLLNYLRIAHKPVGYLVNFGPHEKLEWKRFVLSQFLPPP
jgi:GxxExxY protein